MLKNRNIILLIVLGIVTCGIYLYYWMYVTADALEQQGQSGGMSALVLLLLCIFIFPVGFLLFGMNADDNLNKIKAQRGIEQADNKILYIILGLLIPIVLICLVQNEINKLVPAEE